MKIVFAGMPWLATNKYFGLKEPLCDSDFSAVSFGAATERKAALFLIVPVQRCLPHLSSFASEFLPADHNPLERTIS